MPDKRPSKILCVQMTGPERSIREFFSRHPMQAESTKRDGDLVVVELFVEEELAERLGSNGVTVKVLYDASARGQERQKEVGKGNRFTGQQRVPRGLGVKIKAGAE